ncbi:MAG: hypothetical protein JSU07_05835 [Bacteroidetes bacterium]|nr:hypothetical protein [Bacteroidota bacterium]
MFSVHLFSNTNMDKCFFNHLITSSEAVLYQSLSLSLELMWKLINLHRYNLSASFINLQTYNGKN